MRRIEFATGVRRETAGAYLRAAGIGVRAPGGWGRRPSANPANEVTTDSGSAEPSEPAPYSKNKPPSVSSCEPYREVIESGLSRGRNAMAIWQDMVTEHGFERGYQSVKRFVHKLQPATLAQAPVVIVKRATGT